MKNHKIHKLYRTALDWVRTLGNFQLKIILYRKVIQSWKENIPHRFCRIFCFRMTVEFSQNFIVSNCIRIFLHPHLQTSQLYNYVFSSHTNVFSAWFLWKHENDAEKLFFKFEMLQQLAETSSSLRLIKSRKVKKSFQIPETT